MIRRTLSIMHKEFLHMFRDPRTLVSLFLIPVMQLFLLGYAANTNVEHLQTAALDMDRSPRSRAILDAYQASNYFDITYYPENQTELAELIDRGKARAGIIIPPGLGQDLEAGRRPEIAFIVDGSDPTIANTSFASAQSVGQAVSVDLIKELMNVDPENQPGLDVRPRVWYNPDMRSANFLVPGVVGMILQMLSMMMTAMAIVREREQGTIEQLIVTPIRSVELILGKVTPYALIVFINVIGVLAIATLWFKVPIHGSVSLLLLLTAYAMISSLALGLLISTIAKSQQEAMLSTYFFMLPTIFLSGYLFPIDAMPKFLQFLSLFVPLRYLLIIIRGIILKGVGWEILIQEIVILGVFSVVILSLAAMRFHKRLDA